MTINKLTNNVKPLDEVDKINETIQLLNGETSFTNSIKSSFNESIKLEKSGGNTYAVVASRTDTNNLISFGIDSGGENRGIWDNKLNKWAFNIANDKAYALGNEIAIKDDLSTKIDGDNASLHALKSYVEKGELLTDQEGLQAVKDYAHSTFDASKFTKVGSPIITSDGIASGFSSSNRLYSTFSLSANNFKITGQFQTPSTLVSGNKRIYKLLPNTVNMMCLDGSNLKIWLGNSSTWSVEGATVANNITANTNYNYDVEYNNSILTVKLNNIVVYSNTVTVTLPTLTAIYICSDASSTDNYFTGSIDLKQFSITVDGQEVFNGNKTGIDTIKADDYTVVGTPTISADGIASGFSSSNYLTKAISIPISSHIEIVSKIDEITSSSAPNRALYSLVSGSTTLFELRFTATGLSFMVIGADTATTRKIFANEISTKKYIKTDYYNGTLNIYTGDTLNSLTAISQNPIIGIYDLAIDKVNIGVTYANTLPFTDGSIDLNAFKIYVNGDLVYQPCLKIPFTKSKTGSKIVDSNYRDRVNDMAEQFGYAPYYTLSDTDYTLPQVELYGYIEKRARDAAHPIGVPFYRLDNTIYDDEVRLEGAEVDKGLYLAIEQKLASYCTASADPTKIILPNFIGKVPWGANDYGYISAGLPNITGTYRRSGSQRTDDATFSGSLYAYDSQSYGKASGDSNSNYNGYQVLGLDASRSSSIYSDSVTTVQPPAFKVRWLARYK